MTRDEWLEAFARAAGVERPTAEEIRVLLELAGAAAHASERTAAPISCWIAARSQVPLDELLSRAEGLAEGADAEP
jgi:hypothetical protein